MEFDMRAVPAIDRYKLMVSTVTPRPIAWVTTRASDGRINAAPYSFFNAVGGDPPMVALGLMRRSDGTLKDTAANITETQEFVVNLVRERDAAAMNITCIDSPPEVDETVIAGLTLAPSSQVAPPRIASAPVSFECKLLHAYYPNGPERGQMVAIGEVLVTHVADEFVLDRERLRLDTPAMQLVARMHGTGWYARSTDLFYMDRPSWAEWQAKEKD